MQPDTNVYLRVATGFRAPSFGAPTGTQAIQVAQSEKNTSYEAGIKAELFDRRARIAFDVFYYDVSHQQLTAVGGSSNQTALINAAHSKGKGAELDFEVRPIPNLTVNLSGSFNQTHIEDKSLAVGPCFNWSFISPEIHCNITNPSNAAGLTLIDGNPLPRPRAGPATCRCATMCRWATAPQPTSTPTGPTAAKSTSSCMSRRSSLVRRWGRAACASATPGRRRKTEIAAFCRNCTNQIRNTGAIDFENATGFINDPIIVGGQFSVKF